MRGARETTRRTRDGSGTIERETHEGADVLSGACLRPGWNSELCWLEVSSPYMVFLASLSSCGKSCFPVRWVSLWRRAGRSGRQLVEKRGALCC